MLTVAEGGVLGAVVIDAHPVMRRNVILAKAELMKLIFMILIGFYRVGLIVGRDFVRTLSIYFSVPSYEFFHANKEMPIGLWAYPAIGLETAVFVFIDDVACVDGVSLLSQCRAASKFLRRPGGWRAL